MTKIRQSNIELCRLVSIILVMLVHTTYQTLGTDVSFGIMLLEGFSIIGVNVFVLITGYFSTTPQISSLFNLAFICLFWMIIKGTCRYIFDQEVDYKYAFFITNSNWFIPAYIGLLLLAPILNVFCNLVTKKTLWVWGLLLLFLEIWFDWLPPRPLVLLGVQNGYSVLSFAILYLLARAIRLYGLPNWIKKNSLMIYVSCSMIFGITMFLLVNMGYNHPWEIEWFMAYINPLVILSSVAFLSFFEQIHFQSNIINHIAKSTLAILLGHSAFFFLYTKNFKYIYENYYGFHSFFYWIVAITIVFVGIIIIDQIRLLLYKPLESLIKTINPPNSIFELTEK